MNTVALIPAFQPSTNLFNVLEGLRRKNIDRVVVDDGSGEHYRGLFQVATNEAIVLTYRANRGKGHALKLGLRYIQEHYPEDTVVVTVDANGCHGTEDALRLATEARRNPHELVLGCKQPDADGMPLRDRLGGQASRAAFGLMSGQWLDGVQTGLRAFTADLITFLLEIGGERYEYEMNVLYACPEHAVAIRQMPVELRKEGRAGLSHYRPVEDTLLMHAGFLSFLGTSFASFVTDLALFGALLSAFAGWGMWGLVLANALARVLSATLAYVLNRSVVFHSEEPSGRTAPRFVACTLALGLASTLLLSLFVGSLQTPAVPTKLIVELMVLMGGWLLQNRFVFRQKAR